MTSFAALLPYGWDAGWQASWQASEHSRNSTRIPGRVVIEEKGGYFVQTPQGERLAQLAGRLRAEIRQGAERPVVGDWVALTAAPGQESAVIHGLLPRRTRLARGAGAGRKARLATAHEQVLAANVDVLFLTTALNGDLNPRRLERYVALAWESGAKPVILLTKPDLCAKIPAALAQVQAAAPGVPVHVVAPRTGQGLEALRTYLQPGQTLALIGSSGVGKTTLINQWLGTERLATGAVSATGEGRHTTTRRQLLLLPGGVCVIDTPGMRELPLWEAEEGLAEAFPDVGALLGRCRFADCAHQAEPGCALRAAVAAGTLAPERLASYLKLRDEQDFLRRRDSPAAQHTAKRRAKVMAKALKARIADKRPEER